MKTLPYFFISFVIFLCLKSSQVQSQNLRKTSAEYSSISTLPCENRSDQIYLFFAGEDIDFRYQKLGFIEVTGEASASLDEVMYRLKYEAWKNCANGIIQLSNINKHSYSTTGESVSSTRLKVYQGIAVHIDTDAEFYFENGYQPDSTLAKTYQKEVLLQTRKTEMKKKEVPILIFLGITIAAAVVVSNQ